MVNFDEDVDDSEFDDEEDEVEDLISGLEEECESVLENKDNAKLLNEIFELARANYEKDKKGWQDLFKDLKFELIATDDEDNLREILAHYLRKAKLELN